MAFDKWFLIKSISNICTIVVLVALWFTCLESKVQREDIKWIRFRYTDDRKKTVSEALYFISRLGTIVSRVWTPVTIRMPIILWSVVLKYYKNKNH